MSYVPESGPKQQPTFNAQIANLAFPSTVDNFVFTGGVSLNKGPISYQPEKLNEEATTEQMKNQFGNSTKKGPNEKKKTDPVKTNPELLYIGKTPYFVTSYPSKGVIASAGIFGGGEVTSYKLVATVRPHTAEIGGAKVETFDYYLVREKIQTFELEGVTVSTREVYVNEEKVFYQKRYTFGKDFSKGGFVKGSLGAKISTDWIDAK